MIRNLILPVCLGAMIGSTASRPQDGAIRSDGVVQDTASSSPAAYVYVASNPKNSSTNEVVAYTAAANGALSPIKGSPFREDVLSMAVNGKFLFAASRSTTDIHSYWIAANGALHYLASTNYAKYNDPGHECGAIGQIFLDHTGSTLYAQEFDGSSACANTVIASFNVEKSNGALKYLGLANEGAFPGVNLAAYFTGDNIYAYTADQSACMYYSIYGFKRGASGLLKNLNFKVDDMPTPPEGVRMYAPDQAATDLRNHVAVTMQPANPPGCAQGPLQLATFTVGPTGNLSTESTWKNMPATAIVTVNDMKMAPSGKLLAVAGQEGLQVFHFNGSAPITHYTGLMTSDPINQMYWDNNNHLYAISGAANKLFVFTITPTEHNHAPGSPYAVSDPVNVIVQPLPRY